MNRFLYQLTIALLIGISALVLRTHTTLAQFDSPEVVTLRVYRLIQEGDNAGSIAQPPTLCTKDDDDIARAYGCTAITEGTNRTPPYPFASSTITISIDSFDGPDNDVYVYPYLWDVVPQELDMNGSQGNKPLAAVEAQMIAARTYIYQRMTYLDQYGTPNNSTQFHVFLPYRYQALTPPQRIRVQAAAAERFYMTEANNTYPLEALYGADNPADTVEGNRPYLKSVVDPISAAYGTVNGTANGGMSSKGASRWSFGHTSSIGAVAADDVRYPSDVSGLGAFWSVRWENALQVLTHYYTGIHIRDANDNNRIVTPNRRWVPLQLFGQDTPDETRLLCKNSPRGFGVAVQNTGIFNWEANAFELSYRTDWQPVTGQATTATSYLPPVLAGGSTTTLVTIPVPDDVAEGSYTIRLEMRKRTESGDYEWFSDDGWPGYPVNVMVVEECSQVYLPLMQAEPSTVPSALFPD